MRAALVLVVALLAAACSASGNDVAVEPESPAASPETGLAIASGLDAIAAAEGTPHVLWFWGAN